MAYIIYNLGEKSLINTWLVGTSGVSESGSTFGVGLGSKSGGVGSDKTLVNGASQSTQIAEIGQSTAAGYARQVVNRNNAGSGGWPVSTLVSLSFQTTAPQVTFTFTGAPLPDTAITLEQFLSSTPIPKLNLEWVDKQMTIVMQQLVPIVRDPAFPAFLHECRWPIEGAFE